MEKVYNTRLGERSSRHRRLNIVSKGVKSCSKWQKGQCCRRYGLYFDGIVLEYDVIGLF